MHASTLIKFHEGLMHGAYLQPCSQHNGAFVPEMRRTLGKTSQVFGILCL